MLSLWELDNSVVNRLNLYSLQSKTLVLHITQSNMIHIHSSFEKY